METKKTDSLPGQGYNLEPLMEFYLMDRYHDFDMKLDIRINSMSDHMDQRLELLQKNSFAFLTASNPIGQILFPEENLKRYRELEHDLSGYETHHGEVRGDDDNCPASAGFFIFQITQGRALQLAIKYGQAAFLYGEKGKLTTLVFCPLKPFDIEILFVDRLKKCFGTSPETDKHHKEKFGSPVIAINKCLNKH